MQQQLDDIYKEIQECLAGKAKHGDKNDDKDKKEERNTVKYMFLHPTPIIEEIVAITDTARQVDE